MNEKEYLVKKELERRAAAARIDCRNKLKAAKSNAVDNSHFVELFAAGKIDGPQFFNSLTAADGILYQTGLHFILAARIDGRLYVNYFPFGNRTVTERQRFADTKHAPFSAQYQAGGIIKAAAVETALLSGTTPPVFIAPDLSGGIKKYIATCLIGEWDTLKNKKQTKDVAARIATIKETLHVLNTPAKKTAKK